MADESKPLEYLVIRGRLDRAGQFSPRRCSSTRYVHSWPEATQPDELTGEIVVEIVADGGEVLQRERAQVRPEEICAPGEARTFRVLAYIGLHPAAVAVRVRRDERVLWEARVPKEPQAAVRLERVPKRGKDKSSEALLRLELSEAADPDLAFITVVFQWAERGFRTVHIGPPTAELALPADDLAGGGECRFLVTYSNGLRAASATTDAFKLAELGPTATIVRPGRGDKLVSGVPVVLEGFAEDPEHPEGVRDADRLQWTVDGSEVGSGPITSVDSLDPGRHEVVLTYRADPEASASVTVTVRENKEPTADQWPEWDVMDVG